MTWLIKDIIMMMGEFSTDIIDFMNFITPLWDRGCPLQPASR
jgi:hypothetical protein